MDRSPPDSDPPNPETPLSAKMTLSWSGIVNRARYLSDVLKDEGFEYKALVGVARGGLPIATMLGHLLDIRTILTLCAKSYDINKEQAKVVIDSYPNPEYVNSEDVLFIDDICDTGATMTAIAAMFPEARRCALVVKPMGMRWVHTWGMCIDQEIWVDFPWELDPKKEGSVFQSLEDTLPS